MPDIKSKKGSLYLSKESKEMRVKKPMITLLPITPPIITFQTACYALMSSFWGIENFKNLTVVHKTTNVQYCNASKCKLHLRKRPSFLTVCYKSLTTQILTNVLNKF